MELDPLKVKDALEREGITHLYHANTVRTALTFLEEGALLSRAAVSHRNLIQTPQQSDVTDKNVGVWGDVFVDTLDMHEHMKRPNVYGPVLFTLHLSVLSRSELSPLWITKTTHNAGMHPCRRLIVITDQLTNGQDRHGV